MSSLESHYSASDIRARILEALRVAGLDTEKRISPAELGALDHFHTGGLKASRELMELADIRQSDRVLDIGAGLGGCARLLAFETECRVDCIEMSGDYCAGAELLNQLTGFENQISVHKGSALELPFPDNTFDVVWMQNVGMNISDKQKLYAEIARVLRPNGRFAFQEMAAGHSATSYYPLPWATDPSDNFLIPADEMAAMLSACGFIAENFLDTSEEHLSGSITNATPSSQGQLGLGVFVDDLALKGKNARRSLEEDQVRLVRGLFRLEPASDR